MSFAAPMWLMLFLPVLAAVALLVRSPGVVRAGLPGAWAKVVQPELHTHMAGRISGQRSGLLRLCFVILALLILALARPAIGTSRVAAYENLIGRAVVLDMSGEVDVVAQQLLVTQLLDVAPDIPTMLIAAADEGYLVVPLTRDTGFLARYLQVLDAGAMPESGQALHLGVARARAALKRSEIIVQQVILVTGGAAPKALPRLAQEGADGMLIAIDATPESWEGAAGALGLKAIAVSDGEDLSVDLRRRADAALQNVPQDGRLNLAPFLIAAAGLCWLGFFRRRVAR